MGARTSFTVHALDRVKERLHLSTDEVQILLDEGLYVPLGYEDRSTRQHRLFYSRPDGRCFVAVQDTSNGVVVTVLPADYRDCSWKISPDACALAMRKLMDPSTTGHTPDHLLKSHTQPLPTPTLERTPRLRLPKTADSYVRLEFRARIRRGDREVIIGFWKDSFHLPDEAALDRLVSDPKILAHARSLLHKRLHDGDQIISTYVIPRQRKTLPTDIHL